MSRYVPCARPGCTRNTRSDGRYNTCSAFCNGLMMIMADYERVAMGVRESDSDEAEYLGRLRESLDEISNWHAEFVRVSRLLKSYRKDGVVR